MVAYAFNLRTQKAEAGGSPLVPSQPHIHSKFQAYNETLIKEKKSERQERKLLMLPQIVPR